MRVRYLRYRMTLKRRAQSLRRDPTPAERKLWYRFLRDLPQKFTRQKPLARFIADFYCAERKLAIELDGDSHFSAPAENYDRSRTLALGELGVRVLRFTNVEVIENFESVCMAVIAALEQAPGPTAVDGHRYP